MSRKIKKVERVGIGMDFGKSCGVAVVRISGSKMWPVLLESWDLPGDRAEFGKLGVTFRYCFGLLCSKARMFGGKVFLAYEDIRFSPVNSGVQAAHVYGAVLGHMTEMCEEFSISYEGIVPVTARVNSVGYGGADKPWIREALERRYDVLLDAGDGPRGGKKYDVSDALCCVDGYARAKGWVERVQKTKRRRL